MTFWKNLLRRRAVSPDPKPLDVGELVNRAQRSIEERKMAAFIAHEVACNDLVRARMKGRGITAAQKAATKALHHKMQMEGLG